MAAEATSILWPPIRPIGAHGRALRVQPRTFLASLLTFLGYYIGSQIGFALTFRPHPVSVLWPPNSILLAALLLTTTRGWSMTLAGAFLAHCLVQLQTHIPVPMMLCYFVSNSCEALIGAGCIRYFIPGRLRFDSLRSTTIFCLCGGLVAPFLSSFLDAGFVRLNHWGTGGYWEIWTIRFFSNVLTALTFAPAVITWFTWRQRPARDWNRKIFLEATLVFFGLAVASYCAFYKEGPAADPVLFLAPLPFLFWAALRLGTRGTTTTTLIITFVAIWSAAHGHGPFTGETPEHNARALQFFLIVMAIPFLFLAAGTKERQTADERFSKAFRCNPDPMWIVRLWDATMIDVNERWEKLFGHRRQEVIGRSVLDVNLWADLVERAEMIRRVKKGAVRDFEVSLRNKAGQLVPVLLSSDVVELGGETSLVIIVRDIRDKKRVEEANRDVGHATELMVLLSAAIAHQINQPLGAILSNAEAAEMLLDSDSPPLEKLREIVNDIRQDDLRATQTMHHLRTLTTKRRAQLQAVNLHELISGLLRSVSDHASRRGVVLESKLKARTYRVLAQPVHLREALLNLIRNAMEALDETARLNRRLIIGTNSNGHQDVEIFVIDFGLGLPPEKLSYLFEPFFTTKENGAGLGLATARSIVEAHDGRIWAENNPEGGAIFRIVLPALNNGDA
jgi:two-component system, LuxR family, sensor kinase FixL